ncbi:helix-turn-helix domain-containing protein [Bacillus sp. IBL03825]|uniref:helix-turn-helix domain-containing protein n=1 Tax=Bacillus sp. IBL03825 TaxID=2953580 RepID=UPI002156FFD7|nr:helix-turn-helix domain-containing protein [Bacillus sp. IBL03825]MCR6850486.1 helix-turn-helix domain-containing protein [Bacillus sp. IBL03825]
MKAYKYRIYPKTFACVRFVYNRMLKGLNFFKNHKINLSNTLPMHSIRLNLRF